MPGIFDTGELERRYRPKISLISGPLDRAEALLEPKLLEPKQVSNRVISALHALD